MAMSHAKQRHEFDGERSGGREHPVVGWIGLLAILITIVLLVWARVAVIGTRDIEQTLVETSPDAAGAGKRAVEEQGAQAREVDEAVTSSRWATGFSP